MLLPLPLPWRGNESHVESGNSRDAGNVGRARDSGSAGVRKICQAAPVTEERSEEQGAAEYFITSKYWI